MSKIISHFHKNKSGIYKISNSINNDFYIGSSRDLHQRKIKHLSDLNKKVHHSLLLQLFVNEYGIDKLKFEVIAIVSKSTDLCQLEERMIRFLDPVYNTGNVVVGEKNYSKSEDFKKRVSLKLKGFKRPERSLSYRKNISKSNSKPILQFDKNGNFIKKWRSRSFAAKELNLNVSKISGCAKNEKNRHSTGGFVWKEEPRQLQFKF